MSLQHWFGPQLVAKMAIGTINSSCLNSMIPLMNDDLRRLMALAALLRQVLPLLLTLNARVWLPLLLVAQFFHDRGRRNGM